MSLRKKDDWDEALEEARTNEIKSGKRLPQKLFIPDEQYDYATSIVISMDDLLDKKEKQE